MEVSLPGRGYAAGKGQLGVCNASPLFFQNSTSLRLGIHWDANVPGTSGCIGLINWEGWEGFCRRMRDIAALRVEFVPLKVQY